MKKLIIIRGISGSGKSYTAKKIYDGILYNLDENDVVRNNITIIEADQYFYDGKNYNFDATLLGDAHTYCRLSVKKEIAIVKCKNIIVSNTFTQFWEMEDYIKLADKYGYLVEIRESDSPWRYNVDECFKRNTHNVPYETIKKQMNRFQGLKHGTYDTKELLEILNESTHNK